MRGNSFKQPNGNKLAEVGGRARDRAAAQVAEPRLHLRIGKGYVDFPVKPGALGYRLEALRSAAGATALVPGFARFRSFELPSASATRLPTSPSIVAKTIDAITKPKRMVNFPASMSLTSHPMIFPLCLARKLLPNRSKFFPLRIRAPVPHAAMSEHNEDSVQNMPWLGTLIRPNSSGSARAWW
jgi:hypothetical protein